ncbi:hypothetical protein GCM10008090_11450 [Arenicella chitinivorans]|uniref:Uncharacterized protein n=1 Tax=Arenicella chitinivorans TaxID=1329800 RepID=A0A918VK26_9GAMM|nr:hypothetical protein [Arenicella chitinivorans]GHA03899.1 hypothetical protein GCM10008090_11450 [Arenicella chitinivorans]
MRHWKDQDLVLYYYGELDDSSALELRQALTNSSDIQARYHGIADFLTQQNIYEPPQPDHNFNQRIMAGIHQEHARQNQPAATPVKPNWLKRLSIGVQDSVWAKTLTTSLLVLAVTTAVFNLGRWSAEPSTSSSSEHIVQSSDQFDTQTSQRVLYAGMRTHMEHSQRLLTRVSNADPDLQRNTGDRQQVMEELIGFNRLYRRLAEQAGDYPLARVLEQNESLLIELNNVIPDSNDQTWRSLEQRVNQSDLVFKLKVANRKLSAKI